MLRIRLSRTGRKNYPSYRIVVAEHARPVKGKIIEIVGHYIPIRDPKVLEFDQKKIQEWISKGAKPTDTVASLLKNAGMTGLDKFIEPRDKKRKKKKESDEEGGEVATAAPAEEEKPAEQKEKPAEQEEKPAEQEEKPAEEAKAPAEKPAEQEEKPAEEAKAPAEKPAEQEEKPAEEAKPPEPPEEKKE